MNSRHFHTPHPTLRQSLISTPLAFACNLVLAYAAFGICRVAFLLENWQAYSKLWAENNTADLLAGAFTFDTSAVLYTHIPYALLMLVPLHWKEGTRWQGVAKWTFLCVNALCVVLNLADAVYFQYTGHRTTVTVFRELQHEHNLATVLSTELLCHWYLVVTALLTVALLWMFYVRPSGRPHTQPRWLYCLLHTVIFVAYVPLAVIGMRGGTTTAVRPITISNANQYVNRPVEAAVVLNTPFSLIRTIHRTVPATPDYFSPTELAHIFSPVHTPSDSLVCRRKNVVVLIVESFGQEYIGAFNRQLDGGQYTGYTPFVDSLVAHSLTFDHSFANGRKSIDAMPSILSGIPMMHESFFLTPFSLNDVSGLARELGSNGYYSAFFHGAKNGSMGFQAFARTTGFQDYFGRSEYGADPRFGGDADFDGTWAIWDEPFLQYFALKMTEFQEPFLSAVFTATSHHPHRIPAQHRERFDLGEPLPMHKCIRYTDYALRRFFATASRQPWYENTIFVLTADHTSQSCRPEYQTDLGYFAVPILFFDPSGEMPQGRRHAIAQQTDILPTLLGWLGCSRRPYVAFGCDLLSTPDSATWAVSYLAGTYQYVKGDYLLQFDGHDVRAIYNYRRDPMLRHNLAGAEPQPQMERELKAVIQQYMTRMNENQLIPR